MFTRTMMKRLKEMNIPVTEEMLIGIAVYVLIATLLALCVIVEGGRRRPIRRVRRRTRSCRVTRTPVTTIGRNVELIVGREKTADDRVGYSLAAPGTRADAECLMLALHFLFEKFDDVRFKFHVPNNAMAVSYAYENFVVGEEAQEFVPKDGRMPDDAFFTYQMLATRVQATLYNEKGVEYLAGVTYYPCLKGEPDALRRGTAEEIALFEADSAGEPYPLRDRRDTVEYRKTRRYSRYCERESRRVLVQEFDAQEARHVCWNYRVGGYEYRECVECQIDAHLYKFERVEEEEEEEEDVEESQDAPELFIAPAPEPRAAEQEESSDDSYLSISIVEHSVPSLGSSFDMLSDTDDEAKRLRNDSDVSVISDVVSDSASEEDVDVAVDDGDYDFCDDSF